MKPTPTVLLLFLVSPPPARADWKPAPGHLLSRWAADVSPQNPRPEYPRPQLVRTDWQNLNGLWDYAIRPRALEKLDHADGKILVPFAVESALSGVMKSPGEANRLWYQKTFAVPPAWNGRRVLLHFDASDWETTVWLNGKPVGTHRGGYDPFSFDVTEALAPTGNQNLTVAVWDPTDKGTQPRGKQLAKPQSIWYTAISGLWGTVWIEPVAAASITALKIVPDIDARTLHLTVNTTGKNVTVKAVALDGDKEISSASGGTSIKLKIANPKLWSPDSPFLYGLKITLSENGAATDEVTSYFAMRKVSLGKDKKGVPRILLNNRFVFQYGPLDQGYFPDGLYTAPTDQALRHDIEVAKQLGFNMLRKHVKIEPSRWYYWCDKLGMLVWQDMPSGDRYIRPKDPDIQRSPESGTQFMAELKAMIDSFGNHPSIVMWVPFNEGWGQWDTRRVADWVHKYDPSRLVDSASGWVDREAGDVHDLHSYPAGEAPPIEKVRAGVLGEFGGIGLPVAGHVWQAQKNWGYLTLKTDDEFRRGYADLVHGLRFLVEQRGLSAAVYTQLTDVEIEVNGLLTYDRAVIKGDSKEIAALNRLVRASTAPPQILLATSEKAATTWRYATAAPADGWQQGSFDDSAWSKGAGGLGTTETTGAHVRTPWKTADIWLRRQFQIAPGKAPRNPQLLVHHNDDVEVYINGVLAAQAPGHTSDYGYIPISEAARTALKPGDNTLAIHCHQTGGGQFIDAGLVDFPVEIAP